jgi:amino acid efflux transporter
VVAGAPVVCLIGAGYVTELTGGGPLARALVAALLLAVVLALAAGGRAPRRPRSCCSWRC